MFKGCRWYQLSPRLASSRLPLYLVFLGVSLLFLVVNLVCALLVKMTAADVKTIVLVRVTINDSLFVLCAVSLSVCLYKVAKMSLANIYLESKVKSQVSLEISEICKDSQNLFEALRRPKTRISNSLT